MFKTLVSLRGILVALIGAGLGAALISVGFNFRLGYHWWIGPPLAYAPAILAGALIALVIDRQVRRWLWP